MCGIAGCFGGRDTATIRKMLSVMEHRGPDDNGIHCTDAATLGHTRLSIVDVAGGHQPLTGCRDGIALVCNGEVYNFQSLRDGLRSTHRLGSESDSEVIVHLYEDRGADCVRVLDGMFAFALLDGRKGNLLLARDPIGIKPLYYGYHGGMLYFSSELGAMSVAGVDDVREFPAGHYYTPATGFVRYYELPRGEKDPIGDVEEAAGLTREAVVRAVEKRLLSDPDIHVGSFCSGGLDSSLVAAIAARRIPNLHTFVVGSRDAQGRESDDLQASRLAAAHIGSTHHEKIITEEEYYQVLPLVIKHLESYDPSLVRCAVPCYFTCRLAAEYVTVVLTGEGADEVFNGYHYMKNLGMDKQNEEARRCLASLHNINLQRADRMGMKFSLELRVPFLDTEIIDLGMKIAPELKVKEHDGASIEKWILRHAFRNTGLLPDEILWRYKVQYTQGAGVQDLGERVAEQEISDTELARMQEQYPGATINSREAAYYFKIFRRYHPQDSILASVGIWSGFDFAEEREKVSGTIDGDLRHAHVAADEAA